MAAPEFLEETVRALMRQEDLSGLPVTERLEQAAMLIDLSGDLSRDEGTARALEWCDSIEKATSGEGDKTLIDYFRANAWANRQRLKHSDVNAAWEWSQEEMQWQVFYLRRAERSSGFASLPIFRRCQIATNLANQLNTVGRFVDAVPVWDRALFADPQFGTALGNKGRGLIAYL